MSCFKPWRVVHLELSDGVPTLAAEPNYQGLYVVFWWHRIPLGHQEILAAQLPMPATQLANLMVQTIAPGVGDRLLAQGFHAPLPGIAQSPTTEPPDLQSLLALNQPLAMLQAQEEQKITGDMPSVSVVICTRDRPEPLARCLQALQTLSHPPSEIVVVDNAPASDTTRQQVAQMPGIRYVVEPRPGLSIARNTGIEHSTGEIIAFTDDDVQVHPDWIKRLQQGFHDPKVMVVTGLVLPVELDTKAQLLFEKRWGFSRGYQPLVFDQQFFEQTQHRGVPVWHIGAGANMAIRRQAFDLVGDFDERLGAGASGCSEDSELWYRVLAAGWSCRYEPTAVVYHQHRRDLQGLGYQLHQYMRGNAASLLIQFAESGHWGNLHRLFVSKPIYYLKVLPRQLLKQLLKNEFETGLIEVTGLLSGVLFYLKNRHRQGV
ncbi:glycosyltransferase [Oculatella sp. LEGE 06141]|uniref:glycosyltransferase family 2 protein n=1 Tax=Oculatella sp. LEGE 06141 TaxID=1828648 RepID=UPI0018816E44|nr:glycosyltransferase [Oculatella sp. LEGE 06141]MBE9178455.1 glycosyltransferase [Oculatella sp. LEGE 06141]